MITADPKMAVNAFQQGERFILFNGDCRRLLEHLPEAVVDAVISSPPYFLGKSFDTSSQLAGFEALHRDIVTPLVRSVAQRGSICWQVGHHVENGVETPLDFVVHGVFGANKELFLRNRIVWTFGHGVHARKRFSGRHETALWYTRGEEYYFDLDAVRVPQKYRGKKYYKGPKKGEWSSNPLGKNPGDVWDIPNVKANHVEKTSHPCQFPIALAQRFVRALTPQDGLIFDPFAGVASAGVAAAIEGRRFIGSELSLEYCQIAEERYRAVQSQTFRHRPVDKPVYQPDPRSEVASNPFVQGEHDTIVFTSQSPP